MVNELVGRNDAFLSLASLMVRLLPNIQKTLLELENLLLTHSTHLHRYTIPLSISPSHSSLDYSSYFEPVADPSHRAPESTESVALCTSDVSDSFEPVAPCQQSQRMSQ